MQEEIMKMLLEIRPEVNFAGSADFIEDGLLDSFDVISLISMMEEKYGIEIDGMEIVPITPERYQQKIQEQAKAMTAGDIVSSMKKN